MACLNLTFLPSPPLLRRAAMSEHHHHHFIIHRPWAVLAMSFRVPPSKNRIAWMMTSLRGTGAMEEAL